MAYTYCYSLSPPPNLHKIQPLPTNLQSPNPFFRSISTIRSPGIRASNSSYSTAVQGEARKPSEEAMSIDNLCGFVNLNVGNWQGSFFQFDTDGNLLHKVSTKLAASSYGEDELISLIQTLYIKQALSSTSFSELDDEVEWAEYKIKEMNMFTVDKYQQIGFFPNEKAFSLRYQTAGMLETVLRQGVLGEDDTGEESPKNLKLPSRRPAVICESCLHSLEKDVRVRAFHIMDPKGIIEMILIFLEERGDVAILPPALDNNVENTDRIVPFLGTWKGHSVTKRSGVYGSTMAEADTVATLEMDDNDHVIQGITSTSAAGDVTTNVPWTGIKSDNLITFNGGYRMTLLPRGMYMGCPCDVGNNVAESLSFHLEFCWLEGPGKRQRLVRTYDVEGQAVSTTYFYETKM